MSAVVKYLYQNLGLDATWSASSEEPTLPVEHLNTHVRGRKVRSTGLDSPWRLVCDFGSATAVSALALVDANVTTSATITIKMHTADSWGTPDFSTTLTPWDATDVGGVLLKLFSSTQTKRYLAVEITDATNPDGYYEVGVVFPSPLYTFPDEAPNDFTWRLVDPSMLSYAPAQTPWTEVREVYAMTECEWKYLTESHVFGTLQPVLRTMGRARDLVQTVFSGAPSADAVSKSLNLYGRLTELPDFEYAFVSGGNSYTWGPVIFRESR